MRVALFTETFLPKVDGIVNSLLHLLDHLSLRGHETLLFAPEGSIDRYRETPVVRLPSRRFPGYGELKLAYPWDRGGRVGACLDDFDPDVVHLLGPVAAGLVGLRQARRRGYPIVSSFHTDIPGFAREWGLGVLSPLLWRALRRVHDKTAVTLAPSAPTAALLESKGFANVAMWSRGVDTALFNPWRRCPEWRQRLTDGHPESPVLLYVGRLSPEKRVGWLGAALEALPGVRLAVVGDGPSRRQLESSLPASRTVFTGYLRGDELAAAYASADAFVFPGANETFGNVILEAMSSGLPVIAPNSGGLLEIVRDGETGVLFEAGEPRSLVDAVRRLARDGALWRRLQSRSRQVALSRSWADALDDLIETYYEVAEVSELRRAA